MDFWPRAFPIWFRKRIPGPFGNQPALGASFSEKLALYNPYLWWKLNEKSGVTITDYGSGAHNAAFVLGSGVMGEDGIGDGETSILFDGTATLAGGTASATLPAAGTMGVWCKYAAATWSDATFRTARCDRGDAANYSRLQKSNTANRLTFSILFGGVGATLDLSSLSPITDWFLFLGTWDGSGTAAYQILKGGTIAKSVTGAAVGTWSTGSTSFQLGFPGQLVKGNHAHMFVLPSKLTGAQLSDLAVL